MYLLNVENRVEFNLIRCGAGLAMCTVKECYPDQLDLSPRWNRAKGLPDTPVLLFMSAPNCAIRMRYFGNHPQAAIVRIGDDQVKIRILLQLDAFEHRGHTERLQLPAAHAGRTHMHPQAVAVRSAHES